MNTSEASINSELVWYASYGSNLAYEKRFLCYIKGGTPVGATVANVGCRDSTPPRDMRPLSFQFELFFAGHFKTWNGAAAFIRPTRNGARALGRMYLITAAQFNDVVLQDKGRPLDGMNILPGLNELVAGGEVQIPTLNTYSQLVVLGTEGGYPVLTFTSPHALPIGAPSEPYIKIIRSGLHET